MEIKDYEFELPKQNNFIKVIGVGGGGSNAAKNMFKVGIVGVDFVVCNTDIQALKLSPIPKKLALGQNLTSGLGAGANPEVGKNAAIESKEDIKNILDDGTKMLFITAGMGGGTGTGAAPIIAEIASKMNILTVGIVTLPFSFEGKKKYLQAQNGIEILREHCDTVLVILNDRMKDLFSDLNLGTAFEKADQVQTTAAKSIAEIITVPGYVNVDFEDVRAVMQKAGTAVMGSGESHGENRAITAVTNALSSPLLEYRNVSGAKKILLSITFGQDSELSMDELTIITDYIRDQVGEEAEMIFGYGFQENLGEKLRVTIIATGFSDLKNFDFFEQKKSDNINAKNTKSDFQTREKNNQIQNQNTANVEKNIENNNLDIPTYKRMKLELESEIKDDSKKIIIF
jgi:cell division protein FtsZ